MIAGTLKGIVSQRLVKTVDGHGRLATCEILVNTGRVHDMILDPKMTGHIHEVIKEGEFYGMQTFDQHLLKHLQAGRVELDEAMRVATHPHDFKLMVSADERLRPLLKQQANISTNGDQAAHEAPAAPAPQVVADVSPEPAPSPMHSPASAPPPGF
jgi:twitching motility protein PilT